MADRIAGAVEEFAGAAVEGTDGAATTGVYCK
jgi:hypothetical protein